MKSYDLLVLSPVEFENISKDLLEAKLKIDFEIFGVGCDGGVDLRHSKNKNNEIIIQCKRYENISDLYSNLKKEVVKIRKLEQQPNRYILTTTVSLNKDQKEKISKILDPYIKDYSDIYGKEQINADLSKFKKIEKKYFKLWLSSTSVLDEILHSKIHNSTDFEVENIIQNVKTYVENESLPKALKILEDNNFVVISGMPGIGKTTLARALSYVLLGRKLKDPKNEKQLVFLSENIADAYTVFDKHKEQVFFYDDFLGTNFLASPIGANADNQLIEFIRKIRNSKNKKLILTTREYILNQAKSEFRLFSDKDFADGEYIIDLSVYTKLVKAKILYNHIYSAGIPSKYLKHFLEDKTYIKLIDHENYNPRLIQTIMKEKPWESTEPNKFPERLVEYFDAPNIIWKEIYENEISENARIVLRTLMMLTSPVDLEDLTDAAWDFLQSTNITSSKSKIEKAIKELEGTFISTNKNSKTNRIIVDYQNPSIFDFLSDYYKGGNKDEFSVSIKNAKFFNQILLIFATDSSSSSSGKVILNDRLKKSIKDKIIESFDDLEWCTSAGVTPYFVIKKDKKKVDMINIIYRTVFNVGLKNDKVLDEFLSTKYKLYLNEFSGISSDIYEAYSVLSYFADYLSREEIVEAARSIISGLSIVTELETILSLKDEFPEEFKEALYGLDIDEVVSEALADEVNMLESEEIDGFLDEFSCYSEDLELDVSLFDDLIEDRKEDLRIEEQREQSYANEHMEEWKPVRHSSSASSSAKTDFKIPPTDNEIIISMFDSLN